jgi:hypothetical protein
MYFEKYIHVVFKFGVNFSFIYLIFLETHKMDFLHKAFNIILVI